MMPAPPTAARPSAPAPEIIVDGTMHGHAWMRRLAGGQYVQLHVVMRPSEHVNTSGLPIYAVYRGTAAEWGALEALSFRLLASAPVRAVGRRIEIDDQRQACRLVNCTRIELLHADRTPNAPAGAGLGLGLSTIGPGAAR